MVRPVSHRRDAGRLHVHGSRWFQADALGVRFEDDDLPLVGITVAAAKLLLRDVWNIPYFADALVNGRPVMAGYVLGPDDRLGFSKRYGFKAGDDQRIEEAEAEGLLAAYPELPRIAEEVRRLNLPPERSLQAMTLVVAQWVQEQFGMPDAGVQRVLEEVVQRLDRIEAVLNCDHGSAYSAALNDLEEIIVETLGEKHMKAAAIADAGRLNHNSHLKETLSGLVKRGILAHGRNGYSVRQRSGPGQD